MRKTFSFAVVHFSVAFSIGWLLTGSVWAGGLIALIEPACNTVAFHIHEKIWKKYERRTQQNVPDKTSTGTPTGICA